MKIVFATNNVHKLREVSQTLGEDFTLVTPRECGVTEDIPENEATLEGNALAKARYIRSRTGLDCFADDTGLEVENRRARFRTAIALIDADGEHIFEGVVEGRIAREERGADGFGYDPLFVPDGCDRTFAEMPADEKNAVSHRGRAVRRLAEYLQNRR